MPYRPLPSRNPRVNPDHQTQPPRPRLFLLLALAALLCLSLALAGCGQNLGASTRGWASVAAANGVVYATTLDGQVHALDDFGPDGVGTRWISTVPGERGFLGAYSAPAVGRYLYVSGIDGFLYALEPSPAGNPVTTVWRQPQVQADDMAPLVGSPGLDEAGGIIAVGSEDGALYAYNALTGESLPWSPFRTDGEIWSTPALRNGVAYFGSQDGRVYALDLATGTIKWQFATGGAVVATPHIHKELLIIGSFDRQLYALGLRDGQLRWQYEAGNWWWATPVSSGRAIFAPAMDGKVYALDENGALLWSYDLGAPVVASPALLQRGLAVATVTGKLSVLRATESDHGPAQEIASLTLGGGEIKAPLSASGARTADAAQRPDSVYVGSDDGTVRRVQMLSGINILWCYDTAGNTRC